MTDTQPSSHRPDKFQDPSPSKFRKQAIVVAIVLVILGIIVFFIASAVAGGIIALLGAVFGLGARVAQGLPLE